MLYLKTFLISIIFILASSLTNGQSLTDVKGIQKDNTPHPVRELYLSTIEAFNQRNLELFLSNFSSDIKMYGTDAMYEGKDALRNRFSTIFRQFPHTRMEIPELELDIISDETVLVNFKWKVYPMGQGPAYEGVGSGLYVVQNEKWIEILEVETITNVDEALQQR